mgnify:CR=1 FL=1
MKIILYLPRSPSILRLRQDGCHILLSQPCFTGFPYPFTASFQTPKPEHCSRCLSFRRKPPLADSALRWYGSTHPVSRIPLFAMRKKNAPKGLWCVFPRSSRESVLSPARIGQFRNSSFSLCQSGQHAADNERAAEDKACCHFFPQKQHAQYG